MQFVASCSPKSAAMMEAEAETSFVTINPKLEARKEAAGNVIRASGTMACVRAWQRIKKSPDGRTDGLGEDARGGGDRRL